MFLPKFNNYNFFNIINLVYETKSSCNSVIKTSATYRMHIITEGKGIYRTEKGDFDLDVGDILFIPPAKPYSIINNKFSLFKIVSINVDEDIFHSQQEESKRTCENSKYVFSSISFII